MRLLRYFSPILLSRSFRALFQGSTWEVLLPRAVFSWVHGPSTTLPHEGLSLFRLLPHAPIIVFHLPHLTGVSVLLALGCSPSALSSFPTVFPCRSSSPSLLPQLSTLIVLSPRSAPTALPARSSCIRIYPFGSFALHLPLFFSIQLFTLISWPRRFSLRAASFIFRRHPLWLRILLSLLPRIVRSTHRTGLSAFYITAYSVPKLLYSIAIMRMNYRSLPLQFCAMSVTQCSPTLC